MIINKQGTYRPFATPLCVYPPPFLAIHHWVVPRRRLATVGRRAFAVHGPMVWNSLLDDLRAQQDYESFRQGLKTWLFSRYYRVQRIRDFRDLYLPYHTCRCWRCASCAKRSTTSSRDTNSSGSTTSCPSRTSERRRRRSDDCWPTPSVSSPRYARETDLRMVGFKGWMDGVEFNAPLDTV